MSEPSTPSILAVALDNYPEQEDSQTIHAEGLAHAETQLVPAINKLSAVISHLGSELLKRSDLETENQALRHKVAILQKPKSAHSTGDAAIIDGSYLSGEI